jgi:hypothetical protein
VVVGAVQIAAVFTSRLVVEEVGAAVVAVAAVVVVVAGLVATVC